MEGLRAIVAPVLHCSICVVLRFENYSIGVSNYRFQPLFRSVCLIILKCFLVDRYSSGFCIIMARIFNAIDTHQTLCKMIHVMGLLKGSI